MDTTSTRFFGMALSFVPGINANFVRHIEETGMRPEEFFSLSRQELISRLELNPDSHHELQIADRMLRDEALFKARKEAEHLDQHGIRVCSLSDEDYPTRLRDIDKAPVTIYALGPADLNAAKMMSVVGTRHATAYGARYVGTLIADLKPYFPELTIVSGLALGIDTMAHQAALDNGLPTIAVVAHGLNTIYPAQNRDLARRIIASGGAIISAYPFGVAPYKSRFLERNQIVATMTDAVLVAESADKGGAMSTAAVASSYGRELLALPGRVTDEMSAGCNRLIRSQKALMAGSAAEIMSALGWQPASLDIQVKQPNLFPELEGIEKTIYDCLHASAEPIAIDALRDRTGIPIHELMATLGEMEFDGILERLPGSRYALILY